jgi:type III pantothenate kinase
MLLAIDIGNTQTSLGLYDDNGLMYRYRIATIATDTADDILARLRGVLRPGVRISDVVIASVVPELTRQWEMATTSPSGKVPLVVGPHTKTGLKTDFDVPYEIGADRIADAVAAIELYGAPCIVVDFGTATNIEAIDKKGIFKGGIIAPGLATSANALFNAAAQLPKMPIEVPGHVIGKNTKHAVQAGLTYGEIDRIDGLVARIFDELGYGASVIATGGLSERVASLSKTITDVNDDLSLEGLRLIYNKN